jgi:hypothetical protein
MALIDCPECGTQGSSAAVSCPKCGYPIAETVRDVINKTGGQKPKKKPMSKAQRVALGFAIVIAVIYAIFYYEPHSQTSGSTPPTESRESRKARQTQLCDEYKRGIKASMPDLFNGDVGREINCSGNAIGTTIKGPARRQPHAEVVLAAMVGGLVDRGVNPRRDEVILTLHIYQTGETVTGGPGFRKLTSASYSPIADSIEDDTS